jgi:hypothetical protein
MTLDVSFCIGVGLARNADDDQRGHGEQLARECQVGRVHQNAVGDEPANDVAAPPRRSIARMASSVAAIAAGLSATRLHNASRQCHIVQIVGLGSPVMRLPFSPERGRFSARSRRRQGISAALRKMIRGRGARGLRIPGCPSC